MQCLRLVYPQITMFNSKRNEIRIKEQLLRAGLATSQLLPERQTLSHFGRQHQRSPGAALRQFADGRILKPELVHEHVEVVGDGHLVWRWIQCPLYVRSKRLKRLFDPVPDGIQ